MTSESPEGVNAPLLGQVVAERYFVEKHLGEGGMGTVYRARHITLEKLVALKVLHGEFSRKQELVDRFLQEAKAASRIRNAHVIDITDFGVTGDGYVFFAMEYLEGKDLHGLLKEATDSGQLVPWERSIDIFLQVCEALAAAHAEGIIHRDLKPENIFLVDGTGRDDYVKLLDFGIAKVETTSEGGENERKLTKTGMLFGTPEYMAPEQARGEKPDHRVDVYAMGCMLFQFLTGTVPFKADSFMAILTQHMVEPVPEISPELLARSGAPIGILQVVHKALEKDRDKRYGSMVELAAAVFDASSETAPAATAPLGKGRNRITRPTFSGDDWTGSVRQFEDEEQDKPIAVAQAVDEAEGDPGGWIKWAIGGSLLLGAGLSAAILLGGKQDPPATPDKASPAGSLEPVQASPAATATAGEAPVPAAPSQTPNLIPDDLSTEPVQDGPAKARIGAKPDRQSDPVNPDRTTPDTLEQGDLEQGNDKNSSDKAKPDRVKPDQVKPGKGEPDGVKPGRGEPKSEGNKPKDDKSGDDPGEPTLKSPFGG